MAIMKQSDCCNCLFVKNVVFESIERGIFDRNIFEKFSMLTSESIQRRCLETITRRKRTELQEQCLLIERPCMQNVVILNSNDNIISQNGDISRQSKGKENKGKERECEQAPTHPHAMEINQNS